MGMFIVANLLGSTVQISMLPLPVLSTLQASGLVFNSICATLILGEPFTRWSLWGTLLVCGGAVLIAVFGAIPSPAHKLEELLELLGRRSFVLWMSFQAVLVVGIAVATDLTNRFTKHSQNPRFRLARGLAYGSISGILSAHALLLAKSAVELVMRTITDRDNQFVHWESWMLVLGLVILALIQLYYLHRGLKLVSTSVLYPLVFCIYNIIAILDGLIYFHQTDLISPLRACLITLGTVILLSGVLALSWRLSDEQHPPAVGQSTLTPGLGLVEDTEGEEEEEELLLSSDIGDEDNLLPTQYSYNTFGPTENGEDASPMGPTRKKSMVPSMKVSTPRWTERAEILGELEDRDTPDSPSPTINRRWSSALPAARGESTPLLLHPRRGTSGGGIIPPSVPETAGADQQGPPAARKAFRRRRKSTGFPGFTARKATRRKSSAGGGGGVLHDALGGLWRLRWWQRQQQQQNRVGDDDDDPEASAGQAGSAVADLPRPEVELSPGRRPGPARYGGGSGGGSGSGSGGGGSGSGGSRSRSVNGDSPV